MPRFNGLFQINLG